MWMSCSDCTTPNSVWVVQPVGVSSATFYASHQFSRPRSDGHRDDAIALLHVQRVDVTEGNLLVHVRVALITVFQSKAARLPLLKVKSSSLEEVHSHALERVC